MMKIDSSRQTLTKQTNRLTDRRTRAPSRSVTNVPIGEVRILKLFTRDRPVRKASYHPQFIFNSNKLVYKRNT